MAESGREIFKKANLAKVTNRHIIKYGKIGDNVGYELTKNDFKEEYYLAFVEKIDEKYIYDTDKCIDGTLEEMLKYIEDCKKEKKLIKFEKTIDKM